jgi:ribose transport system substrate-binding protein
VKQRLLLRASAVIVCASLVAACGDSGSKTSPGSDSKSSGASFDLTAATKGPNGESATPAASVPALSPEDVEKVKQGQYKVAILHGGSGTWYTAMENGARAEAQALGMQIVATAQADFDPAKQASQLETAMAKNPNVIVTLPVDPVSAAAAFKPAVDAKAKLMFVDNGVKGYQAGKEYVSIVTGDHYQQGIAAAKLMAEALGKKGGKIGYIYHDADFYVTNNRDKAFKAYLQKNHPEIKFVAEQGFTAESQTSEIAASMLTRNPDLDGLYVAWSAAATGALGALRDAGSNKTKVITYDLDATNDLQIAKGGNLYGSVADRPYLEGQLMIRLAAQSLLGRQTPPFVVVDPVVETKSTVQQAWKDSANQDPPAEIMSAIKK